MGQQVQAQAQAEAERRLLYIATKLVSPSAVSMSSESKVFKDLKGMAWLPALAPLQPLGGGGGVSHPPLSLPPLLAPGKAALCAPTGEVVHTYGNAVLYTHRELASQEASHLCDKLGVHVRPSPPLSLACLQALSQPPSSPGLLVRNLRSDCSAPGEVTLDEVVKAELAGAQAGWASGATALVRMGTLRTLYESACTAECEAALKSQPLFFVPVKGWVIDASPTRDNQLVLGRFVGLEDCCFLDKENNRGGYLRHYDVWEPAALGMYADGELQQNRAGRLIYDWQRTGKNRVKVWNALQKRVLAQVTTLAREASERAAAAAATTTSLVGAGASEIPAPPSANPALAALASGGKQYRTAEADPVLFMAVATKSISEDMSNELLQEAGITLLLPARPLITHPNLFGSRG